MSSKLKPTGFKPAFLRECLDVLSAEPPTIRWRFRPREHFPLGEFGERAFKAWGKSFAGQLIRAGSDGRFRLSLSGRTISGAAVIAEIGVTPIGDRQGMPEGMTDDRFADTRDLAGSGKLAAIVQAALADTRRPINDLMVMGGADPYRLDTKAKHRDAQWFAAQVARFIDPDKNIHQRGVFYACVSAGDLKLPDGTPFTNTEETATFVGEASQFARWLGYVPFERLVDAKNDKPIVRLAASRESPSAQVWANKLEIEELDADALDVWSGLAHFEPRQPNRLVFFGEKTSLFDVLDPLAIELNADLYLMSGQISDTYLYQMAKDAAADGRPLVVFTFSDFDPAGYWDMPTAIGRKLQALRDLMFPELEFTVVHAALGPDQVADLPSSPLKDGESRAAKWKELYGHEQTEIDALATLQPRRLEQIARDAVAPYFDSGLAARVQAARDAWQEIADAEVAEQIDADRLDRLKNRAADALDELRAVNAELDAMADEIVVAEPPDLPEPDMEALEAAQDERRDSVLIDSGMDYVEATDRLRAHSEKVARHKPKPTRRRHQRGFLMRRRSPVRRIARSSEPVSARCWGCLLATGAGTGVALPNGRGYITEAHW